MATGVQVWSQTAATNATVDTNVNWAEGMAPSAVNDSARAEMASVAKWRDDNSGSLITSGSSTAFTLATNQVATALTSGYTVYFQFHTRAAAGATLNVDGLGAKPLQVYPGTNIGTQEYLGGNRGTFTYSSTGTGQWIAMDSRGLPWAFNIPGDVALTTSFSNVATVTNGTSGNWFFSGYVLLNSTSTSSSRYNVRLYDGTNTYGSATVDVSTANAYVTVHLSAMANPPAGNVSIQAMSSLATGTTARASANSGDAGGTQLTAIRIG